MKVSHSMCGPHKDNGIIFAPVRHFAWTSCARGTSRSST